MLQHQGSAPRGVQLHIRSLPSRIATVRLPPLCQVLYSDCGTNFISADATLRSLFTVSSKETCHIERALAEERIQWRFKRPHTSGGLWEAAVKSLKHLRRVIGNSTLTFEEMTTLLT